MAQNQNQDKMQATMYKTFTIEKDGTMATYNVKVLEHRDYSMKWDASDKGKIDQDRKNNRCQSNQTDCNRY